MHDDTMVRRSTPTWRRRFLLLGAAVSAAGCGGAGRATGPTTIDLREPTTVLQFDPDAGNTTLATVEGLADYTVRLPHRTVIGRFRSVALFAPILAEPLPDDDPARAIDEVQFKYEFTDDPDTVLAQFDELIATYRDDGTEREALLAFRDSFEASVEANGGTIVDDDILGDRNSSIVAFRLEQTDHDLVTLQFRVWSDGDVAMNVTVSTDGGTV
jgi:hypothetical protein